MSLKSIRPYVSIFLLYLAALFWCSDGHARTAPGDTVTTVTVTGQRKDVSNRIDRKVYRTGQNLQSTSGSAADVLSSVPSVSVDGDGNVSLRGDSKVTILVDGKPATQFAGTSGADGLQLLPADSIDSVEIITNPSAQYDASGASGIINIITKKGHTPSGSSATTVSAGNKQRFFLSTSTSLKRGPLTLNGALSFRQDDKLRRVHDYRVTGFSSLSGLNSASETLQEHQRREMPSISGSAEYQIGDRNSIGINVSHAERGGARFFTQNNSSTSAAGPVSASVRYSDGEDWRLDAAQGGHFDTKLGRDGETLSLAVQHSVTCEREHYAYLNHYALPVKSDNRDHLNLSLDLAITEVKADYVLPLGGGASLKVGYKYHRDDNNYDNSGDTLDASTSLFTVNPDITNHFRYRQAIQAGYVSYQTHLGSWDVISGLRAESVNVRTIQITGGLSHANSYERLYPSLHLQRAVSEAAKLSLSYSQRVTRPDPEELNPYSDHQDIHNLRAGNPYLRPQDTQSFEAGISSDQSGLTSSATAYVRFNRYAVTDITRVIDAETVLATKVNLPKSRAAGFEFAINGKALSTFTYAVSGNLANTQIDARTLGAAGLKAATGLNLKASLDYRPARDDDLQVSVNRTDKRLTPQGEIAAINLVNLGYKHQLNPRTALVFTVIDLFNGQKMVRRLVTPTLDDTFSRHQVGQVAYLTLSYTFGSGHKKAAAFDYDQGN